MARGRKSKASASSSSAQAPAKVRKTESNSWNHPKITAELGHELEGRMKWISSEQHKEKLQLLATVSSGSALGFQSVDLNKEKNRMDHHTWEFEASELIVRRGQDFTITINFDRDISVEKDSVVLQFSFGSHPLESKGTLLRFKLDLKNKTSVSSVVENWTAIVQRLEGSAINVAIKTTANACVGKYRIYVETSTKGNGYSVSRNEVKDEDVVLIFNPWCSADVVYIANGDERYEYVLNDHGRIWKHMAHDGLPWNFGQFDNPVLEAAFFLMDRVEISDTARRSPVFFVRTFVAQVNKADDQGVLEGRWTQSYPAEGTSPLAWAGSHQILQQFMTTGKSVHFGQCWVFAGVATSLLRALGIPTRVVTTFVSGIDRDNTTIDTFISEDDEWIEWMGRDSDWNFHVWNESYFRRPDLPRGYDGWQVFDPTPQIGSDGVTRCGPAPVKAVKHGHNHLNYDVGTVFSAVNGDQIFWKVLKNGEIKVIDLNPGYIGKHISTKAVSGNFRHDLTSDYKHPEGSSEGRQVVESVCPHNGKVRHNLDKLLPEDVKFELVVPKTADVGEDFQAIVRVRSKADKNRTVSGRIVVYSTSYTGILAENLKGEAVKEVVPSNQGSDLVLDIEAKDYLGKMNPEVNFKAFCSVSVKETGQVFIRTIPFSLNMPVLDIMVPDDIKINTEYSGTVTFTNILDIELTSACINLEGASVLRADVMQKFSEPVKPKEQVKYEFKFCPRRAGLREIQAVFSSDQLGNVWGDVEFEVQREG